MNIVAKDLLLLDQEQGTLAGWSFDDLLAPPPTSRPRRLADMRSRQVANIRARRAPPLPVWFMDRFAAANVTADGRLTQEQAQLGGMLIVARDFTTFDTTGRGYVTLDDFRRHAAELMP